MKKLWLSLTFSVVFTAIYAVAPVDSSQYAIPSQEQLHAYYVDITKQLDKAQEKVDKQVDVDLTKVDVGTWHEELKQAIFEAKVKFLLAWMFRDHIALRSPEIRTQLLALISAENITNEETQAFIKLVEEEQPKILEVQRQEEELLLQQKPSGN